jgi:cytochrome d ubiquinol oxidase subunit II
MSESDGLAILLGSVGLAAVIAYAVLAGADFGGGVWDLLAFGPRAEQHRAAIRRAMGPVWEANHVWLIFVIVILFSGFPAAFAALSVALFWPFHLVLAGIVLRGSALAFRAHSQDGAGGGTWRRIFGGASLLTPLLLGASLGAVSSGRIRVEQGEVTAGLAWLSPLAMATALLGLVLCVYLATVYLTLETDGTVCEDFRQRALWTWLVGGAISIGTLLVVYAEAPHLWTGLTRVPSVLFVAGGIALAPASAIGLWTRHFGWARVCAAGQVVLLLAGWALAQWPYVIYPDVRLFESAAPAATLKALLITLPFGLAMLVPSLVLLFTVFKGQDSPLPHGGRGLGRGEKSASGRRGI